MQWIRDYRPRPEESRLYRNALIVTVAGNVFLAVSKGIVAYLSRSVALYADAANSASDVLYSMLMVLGLWMSQRPPDLSHPQGHSRFEPLVGLAVAFSMAFAGYEAARASLVRFQTGGLAVEPGLPTLILLVSAAVKAGMFLYIRGIARKLGSPALNVTARDHLSDVLTSVAAFVGIYGSKYIHPLADPIAGFLVAAWIFRAAFGAILENIGFLTGAGADSGLRDRIVQIAAEVPGVTMVHHTMTDYVGPRLVIDMHINVDGEITLNQAHAIADQVIARLEALPEVDRAYVHVEPQGWEDPPHEPVDSAGNPSSAR
ncbi:MAG TPA: cation diffusion facilitator family transporter [Anaerolineaceae bacterium]|nr:cation diffusion facilitator family transporter [Anaerolineaceae bacterium]